MIQSSFCDRARNNAVAQDHVQAELIRLLALRIAETEQQEITNRVAELRKLFNGLNRDQAKKLQSRLTDETDYLARFFDCELATWLRVELLNTLETRAAADLDIKNHVEIKDSDRGIEDRLKDDTPSPVPLTDWIWKRTETDERGTDDDDPSEKIPINQPPPSLRWRPPPSPPWKRGDKSTDSIIRDARQLLEQLKRNAQSPATIRALEKHLKQVSEEIHYIISNSRIWTVIRAGGELAIVGGELVLRSSLEGVESNMRPFNSVMAGLAIGPIPVLVLIYSSVDPLRVYSLESSIRALWSYTDNLKRQQYTSGAGLRSTSEAPRGPETGAQLEERLLREDRPSRVRSSTYFDWEGGSRGTFGSFADSLRRYAQENSVRIPRLNRRVLRQSTLEFIRSKPELKRLWDAQIEPIAEAIHQNQIIMRNADPVTRRQLRRENTESQIHLDELLDWASRPVQGKRPDLIEVWPQDHRIRVTDITQRPYDRSHNFKTRFYVEVLKKLTGWTDVAGLEYKSNAIQRFIK